jgi:hypothetical protein
LEIELSLNQTEIAIKQTNQQLDQMIEQLKQRNNNRIKLDTQTVK